MPCWSAIAGLGLALGGAVLVAWADAWFSRAVLIYLDAIQTNVAQVVQALRSGGTSPRITEVNPQRDRTQNRARSMKLLGWCVLILGFLVQILAAWLAMRVVASR